MQEISMFPVFLWVSIFITRIQTHKWVRDKRKWGWLEQSLRQGCSASSPSCLFHVFSCSVKAALASLGSVASFPGAHKRWLGEGRLQKWPEGGFWSFFPVWSFKTNSFSFSSALLTLEKQFWFYRKPQAKWMALKPHTFLAVLRAVLKGPQV